MTMINLLVETRDAMHTVGKGPANVAWIGGRYSNHVCTWAEFEVLADGSYDSGFGAAQVAEDLVIVFNDNTWLSREEYDGSEWWAYNEPPRAPALSDRVWMTRVMRGAWNTVAEMHAEDWEYYDA